MSLWRVLLVSVAALLFVLSNCGVRPTNNPPVITIKSPEVGAVLDIEYPTEITLEWDISDPESHQWTVDVFFGEKGGTLQKVVENQAVKSVKVTVDFGKDYEWKVVATDALGETSEKTAIFTTGKGKVRIYVVEYNSGPAVPRATVVVKDHETGEQIAQLETNENGEAVLDLSGVSAERIDIEAKKFGYALSKVVGVKVARAKVKPVEMQLRVAQLNPDPSTQTIPNVQVELLNVEGEPLTSPATEVFRVHVSVESENHVSLIYCLLGRIPGSSFFGPRSVVSDTNEAYFTVLTTGWVGETELNIVVYDYNDNRVHVIEYVDIVQESQRPEYVFVPLPPTLLGYVNLVAYTRNDAAEFYNKDAPQAVRQLVQRSERTVDRLSRTLTKDFGAKLHAAPEGTNLFVEVTWLNYGLLEYYGLIGPLAQRPDGYNVYRSFDGVRYEKVAFVPESINSFYIYDTSAQMAPGKPVWYAVSSVYGGYETEKTFLGSVVPLASFNVELIEPEDGATNVSVRPTFKWKPTLLLTTPESTVDYYYTMAIYDAVLSEILMVPVYIQEGSLYLQEWYAPDDRMIEAKFDDYMWYAFGAGLWPYDRLEYHKTYDWGVDYAIAVSQDVDSQAFSIAIDYGWGIDPVGGAGVLPDKHNEFTTGSE